MIHDLDEALRQLLIRELPVKNSEIDIRFDQPKREWSARLNRPTLNLFLYDVRENVKLRQYSPHWVVEKEAETSVTQRRAAVRLNLHYAITAWANDPEDEHRMLSRTLMVLFRNRVLKLPEDVMPKTLRDLPSPVQFTVAQPDMMHNPSDFWSAMDNEIRPAVICTILLALNPYQAVETPMIQHPPLFKFREPSSPTPEAPMASQFWPVEGVLEGVPHLSRVRMFLVELGRDIPVRHDGSFMLPRLREGEYTLEIAVVGGDRSRYTITVPSRQYVIDVSNEV